MCDAYIEVVGPTNCACPYIYVCVCVYVYRKRNKSQRAIDEKEEAYKGMYRTYGVVFCEKDTRAFFLFCSEMEMELKVGWR